MGDKPRGNKNTDSPPKRRGLYLVMVVLISGWMFFLGVLVGRGNSPVRFDMEKLRQEILSLKTAALKGETEDIKTDPGGPELKKELGFYDALKKDRDNIPDFIERKKEEIKEPAPENENPDENTDAQKADPEKIDLEKVEPPRNTPAEEPEKNYSIQVASSKDPGEAEKLVAIYRANGFPAYGVSVQVNDTGTWHRIRIGPFKTFMEANTVLSKIKRERPDALVLEHDPIGSGKAP